MNGLFSHLRLFHIDFLVISNSLRKIKKWYTLSQMFEEETFLSKNMDETWNKWNNRSDEPVCWR